MCNRISIFILILCVIRQAEFKILENIANGSLSEATVLPYSLKVVRKKEDNGGVGGLYTLMETVKPSSSNNQAEEHQLNDESSNMNILQNRRTEGDPWQRISVHYKNQLAQTKGPSDEYGYYNLNGVAATHHLNVGNHFGFGVGPATVPLPLVLILMVNIGLLIYLVFGIIATLSAVGPGGFNYRLPAPSPHNVYFRSDEHDSKYF